MWPLGNNHWAYKLYGPLNILGTFSYRYCRNGQCGSADDVQTVGAAPTGRQAITTLTGQDIQDTVSAWKWFENPEPVTLVGANITPRASGFIAGVEFQSTYRPNWSYYAPQAFANTQALGANIVVLTPSWTYTNISPLGFAPVPGQDPLWIDSAIMISQARALGLNVSLFPTPNFPASADHFDCAQHKLLAECATRCTVVADVVYPLPRIRHQLRRPRRPNRLANPHPRRRLGNPSPARRQTARWQPIQRPGRQRSAMEIHHRRSTSAFQGTDLVGIALHQSHT